MTILVLLSKSIFRGITSPISADNNFADISSKDCWASALSLVQRDIIESSGTKIIIANNIPTTKFKLMFEPFLFIVAPGLVPVKVGIMTCILLAGSCLLLSIGRLFLGSRKAALQVVLCILWGHWDRMGM